MEKWIAIKLVRIDFSIYLGIDSIILYPYSFFSKLGAFGSYELSSPPTWWWNWRTRLARNCWLVVSNELNAVRRGKWESGGFKHFSIFFKADFSNFWFPVTKTFGVEIINRTRNEESIGDMIVTYFWGDLWIANLRFSRFWTGKIGCLYRHYAIDSIMDRNSDEQSHFEPRQRKMGLLDDNVVTSEMTIPNSSEMGLDWSNLKPSPAGLWVLTLSCFGKWRLRYDGNCMQSVDMQPVDICWMAVVNVLFGGGGDTHDGPQRNVR